MINVNQDICTGCGHCVKVCPHRVLKRNGRKAVLAHEERCIECGACQLNCREEAITVTKGTGCLFIIIKEDILKIQPEASA